MKCCINDCQNEATRPRGWCNTHYMRWFRHGDPQQVGTPKGDAFRFLDAMRTHQGNDCVLWPYNRHVKGYGKITLNGRARNAHAMICEWVHGAKPSAEMHAAHECGNAACVNPKHIRWATVAENYEDGRRLGRNAQGEKHGHAKLTQEQVQYIRTDGRMFSASELGSMYGVSKDAIVSVRSRKTWAWLP